MPDPDKTVTAKTEPHPWQITASGDAPVTADCSAWTGGQSVFVYRGDDIERAGTTLRIRPLGECPTSIHLETVDAACAMLEHLAALVAEWGRHEHGPGKVAQ